MIKINNVYKTIIIKKTFITVVKLLILFLHLGTALKKLTQLKQLSCIFEQIFKNTKKTKKTTTFYNCLQAYTTLLLSVFKYNK
jgi:hypothetical protein